VVPTTVPVHRLSVEDVHRMVAAGVLGEDERIELVDGILVEMTPIGAEHDGALAWLTRHLASPAADAWEARIQSTFLIPGGYLLPDLALVEPLPRTRQPETAVLVVEIAQTSQARDSEKAADYAHAGVPDYWLVDLPGRVVIVHRGPEPGGYGRVERLGDGATLTPIAEGTPPIEVSELLG
jgi:Uma2 family endonuclease